MKKARHTTERNTGLKQNGGGNSYGVGMKQKIGKSIDVFPHGNPIKNKSKPPKSLA
jgi:hypothetical protein